MLLESIRLENFRQFRDEFMEFATGKDGRNVTIIIGENGDGKTTFAQAFFWCLYGTTEFKDKIMLNKVVAQEMTPDKTAEVKVTLKLHHGELFYKITREQTFHKDNSNKIKADNAVFNIEKKDATGNTSFVNSSQCAMEIESILSKELSRYFFFDGERITGISKDISSSKKVNDFASAVKGLLGLNGMDSAINHFNPNSKYGVIGSYEASFDGKSNEKVAQYAEIIASKKEELEKIELRLQELEETARKAESDKKRFLEEQKSYKEAEDLQREKESLQGKIRYLESQRNERYVSMCQSFQANMDSYCAMPLIIPSLEMISKCNFAGKDIPQMHSKTVKHLLKEKVCICGCNLEEGTEACRTLTDLLNYLPPQSISTTISEFKKDSKARMKQLHDKKEKVQIDFGKVSEYEDEIESYKDEIQRIEKQLSGDNVREKVRTLQARIQECEKILNKIPREREELRSKEGSLQTQLERAETERREFSMTDVRNKEIEISIAYAREVYEELCKTYKSSETEIRERLEKTINEIFLDIYAGSLYLSIDENYHISVSVEDLDGFVETSTAQSISVIFAFITGIIRMTRENRTSTDESAKLLSSEPYPLVMDAPLSTFDKRRIKTVCESLPSVAEQVIIFIKDTEGDLAKEYIESKIGSEYSFDLISNVETKLVKERAYV